MIQIGVAAMLVCVVAWVLYTFLNPVGQVVIKYNQGSVRIRGKWPQSRKKEADEFFRREFAGSPSITVVCHRDRSGRSRIIVRGSIAPGDQQRIRNFMQLP